MNEGTFYSSEVPGSPTPPQLYFGTTKAVTIFIQQDGLAHLTSVKCAYAIMNCLLSQSSLSLSVIYSSDHNFNKATFQ